MGVKYGEYVVIKNKKELFEAQFITGVIKSKSLTLVATFNV